MCVNLQTSIVAFIIGEICGFILATENNEKRAIGIFVMFYSFVQLFEALIYYYGNDESTVKDFKPANIETCMKWNFIDTNIEHISYYI